MMSKDTLAAEYIAWEEAQSLPPTAVHEWKSRRWSWCEAHGISYLGVGADRVVFALPEGALKIAVTEWQRQANHMEARVWREAPPWVKVHLVPVLDAALDGSWLLMEQVQAGGLMAKGTVTRLKSCGFIDFARANQSVDGRLLDYGSTFWPSDAGELPPG